MSNVTCERTFSCLGRIKTYLRNKIIDERLTNLEFINTERPFSKNFKLR